MAAIWISNILIKRREVRVAMDRKKKGCHGLSLDDWAVYVSIITVVLNVILNLDKIKFFVGCVLSYLHLSAM